MNECLGPPAWLEFHCSSAQRPWGPALSNPDSSVLRKRVCYVTVTQTHCSTSAGFWKSSRLYSLCCWESESELISRISVIQIKIWDLKKNWRNGKQVSSVVWSFPSFWRNLWSWAWRRENREICEKWGKLESLMCRIFLWFCGKMVCADASKERFGGKLFLQRT